MCASSLHTLLNKIYKSISLNHDDDGGYGYLVLLDTKAWTARERGEDWVSCIYRIDGGWDGENAFCGFSFSFLFLFSLPFLRIVGKKRSRGGYESKKQNIMNLGLGKQAIGSLCTESVPKKRSMYALPSLPLSLFPFFSFIVALSRRS